MLGRIQVREEDQRDEEEEVVHGEDDGQSGRLVVTREDGDRVVTFWVHLLPGDVNGCLASSRSVDLPYGSLISFVLSVLELSKGVVELLFSLSIASLVA